MGCSRITSLFLMIAIALPTRAMAEGCMNPPSVSGDKPEYFVRTIGCKNSRCISALNSNQNASVPLKPGKYELIYVPAMPKDKSVGFNSAVIFQQTREHLNDNTKIGISRRAIPAHFECVIPNTKEAREEFEREVLTYSDYDKWHRGAGANDRGEPSRTLRFKFHFRYRNIADRPRKSCVVTFNEYTVYRFLYEDKNDVGGFFARLAARVGVNEGIVDTAIADSPLVVKRETLVDNYSLTPDKMKAKRLPCTRMRFEIEKRDDDIKISVDDISGFSLVKGSYSKVQDNFRFRGE